MSVLVRYLRQSATYKISQSIGKVLFDILCTIGDISFIAIHVIKNIIKGEINWREVVVQCDRFGISSLPITLSIVGMTSIIVASQVAHEMVKQGAGHFVGLLMTMLIVREVAAIMSGFAIISMIGSSLASELATMRVTEQIDAIDVLKVDPIRYLFVPRVVSGLLMMPFLTIISAFFGVILGAVTAYVFAGLSYRAYFDSAWLGLYMKDLGVCILKATTFGFVIALISCVCGYKASGGAKGVGLATTKAVVWSFITIVIIDMVFAVLFFF